MKEHCEMIIDYLTDGTDFEYYDNHGVLRRCKDCTRYNVYGWCSKHCEYVKEDDFCSRAVGK